MFFLHYMLYILRYEKNIVKLVNRLLHNTTHQLVTYSWVFVNSESIFYFMESFFPRKRLLWSPCLLLITESISLDASDKTTSEIFVQQSEKRLMILHHLLTTTSACKISHKIFPNNSINNTFTWCINNFFLETLFLFFFLGFFSLPTWLLYLLLFLCLGSWIFWQLSFCFRVSSCIFFFNCLLWMVVTVCKVKFTLWKHW